MNSLINWRLATFSHLRESLGPSADSDGCEVGSGGVHLVRAALCFGTSLVLIDSSSSWLKLCIHKNKWPVNAIISIDYISIYISVNDIAWVFQAYGYGWRKPCMKQLYTFFIVLTLYASHLSEDGKIFFPFIQGRLVPCWNVCFSFY